jgi:hypothetical protein
MLGVRLCENLAVVERLGVGPAHPVVPMGRTSEFGEVERFLSSGLAGRVLVVCGEAGIGKTVVWEAGVELARSPGFGVLCARGSEAVAQLAFAGVADLLEGVDVGVLSELPAAQRRALEVALGRAEPGDRAGEPFAVAAGLLEVLRVVSGRDRV